MDSAVHVLKYIPVNIHQNEHLTKWMTMYPSE